MTLPLADAFASAHATRIDWDGKPTHAIFEIAPAPGGVIVDFLAMTHTPVQGLAIGQPVAICWSTGSRRRRWFSGSIRPRLAFI